jgi:5-formyltetrahydrofolate cyclo-ligase
MLREAIPAIRRQEAAQAILDRFKNRGRILSFYSIGSEMDLSLLNAHLAQQGRLMSNRLESTGLTPYHVHSENELIVSRLGIPEPDPKKSRKALLTEIDLILVPALAFDREGYRLGYGKGYYDRFLANVGAIPTVGVGFREQLSKESLPKDPWDIPVQQLVLV